MAQRAFSVLGRRGETCECVLGQTDAGECRDAIVQDDLMKACRKISEAKKHETAM